MSKPEWHIFDRLDELENITLELMEKADTTEPSLKNTSARAHDASILALFALVTAFGAVASDVQNPRALKDGYIVNLKRAGLSQKMLELAGNVLVQMCKLIEETETGKQSRV